MGGPPPGASKIGKNSGVGGWLGNVSNTSKFCVRAMQHCLRLAPNHAGLAIMDCNIEVNETGCSRTSMVCAYCYGYTNGHNHVSTYCYGYKYMH